ncbi:PadR family transcriptional regulator [Staphylococcus chromogenes]|nr:PadR family transcriptional regulator [Staphylococcus chromogenes]
MPIPHSLLTLLAEKPRSASELRRSFEEITMQLWPLNQGQVSQTLNRLQRDGFVEKHGQAVGERGHTTDLFAITQAGRDELERWFSRATVQAENERDELVIKIAVAQSVRKSDTEQLIQLQREAVMQQLRETMRQSRETPPERSAQRLLLERRIFNLEAENRWLDYIETLKDPQ